MGALFGPGVFLVDAQFAVVTDRIVAVLNWVAGPRQP